MPERQHALENFLRLPNIAAAADHAIEIVVDPTQQHIVLRADSGNSAFLDAVRGELGQDIPLQANTTTRGEHVVLWLGPDEWLIAARQDAGALIGQLRQALGGQFVTFTNISDGQVNLRLSGDRVRHVLCKGCTLDLHPDRFLPGSCAQTALAKASMLISLPAAGCRFDILVRRSFAEYVALWLRHAAAEYGFRATMLDRHRADYD